MTFEVSKSSCNEPSVVVVAAVDGDGVMRLGTVLSERMLKICFKCRI